MSRDDEVGAGVDVWSHPLAPVLQARREDQRPTHVHTIDGGHIYGLVRNVTPSVVVLTAGLDEFVVDLATVVVVQTANA